jgi:hypothetical protein
MYETTAEGMSGDLDAALPSARRWCHRPACGASPATVAGGYVTGLPGALRAYAGNV